MLGSPADTSSIFPTFMHLDPPMIPRRTVVQLHKLQSRSGNRVHRHWTSPRCPHPGRLAPRSPLPGFSGTELAIDAGFVLLRRRLKRSGKLILKRINSVSVQTLLRALPQVLFSEMLWCMLISMWVEDGWFRYIAPWRDYRRYSFVS